MSVNVPLLRKVVEWVEEQEKRDDSEWDQGYWCYDYSRLDPASREYEGVARDFCGTRMCFAGKTVLMEGWTPHFYDGTGTGVTSLVIKDGHIRDIEDTAAELLGLDPEQTEDLFDGTITSAAKIRAIAEDLAGEPL